MENAFNAKVAEDAPECAAQPNLLRSSRILYGFGVKAFF
jgi:hypothetical protein